MEKNNFTSTFPISVNENITAHDFV